MDKGAVGICYHQRFIAGLVHGFGQLEQGIVLRALYDHAQQVGAIGQQAQLSGIGRSGNGGKQVEHPGDAALQVEYRLGPAGVQAGINGYAGVAVPRFGG